MQLCYFEVFWEPSRFIFVIGELSKASFDCSTSKQPLIEWAVLDFIILQWDALDVYSVQLDLMLFSYLVILLYQPLLKVDQAGLITFRKTQPIMLLDSFYDPRFNPDDFNII